MKAILCAALVATAALTPGLSANAAPVMAAFDLPLQDMVQRRAHHCDTPAQIATNAICQKL